MNENYSLNSSNDQNHTDAEQIKKEEVHVFTETGFETPSNTAVSRKPILLFVLSFSVPEDFLKLPVALPTHYISMKNDYGD